MPCQKHHRMAEPDQCPDCVREDRDRLAKIVAEMRAEQMHRGHTDPTERLHNLVDGLASLDYDDAHSLEEWDRLDKENVRLTNIAKRQKEALQTISEAVVNGLHLDDGDPNLTTWAKQLGRLMRTNQAYRRVYDEIQHLRKRGYDGPFMGLSIEPLFIAINAAERVLEGKGDDTDTRSSKDDPSVVTQPECS